MPVAGRSQTRFAPVAGNPRKCFWVFVYVTTVSPRATSLCEGCWSYLLQCVFYDFSYIITVKYCSKGMEESPITFSLVFNGLRLVARRD